MVDVSQCKIGFIGFGNMASAMADGWIASGAVPAGNLYACAGRYEELVPRCEVRGMHALAGAAEVVDAADVVVIALKPYMIESVLRWQAPLPQRPFCLLPRAGAATAMRSCFLVRIISRPCPTPPFPSMRA